MKALPDTPSRTIVKPGEIRGMARTDVVLDDRLVQEGLRRFQCRSKRELVHLTLTGLLKSARRRDLPQLRGQVKWEGGLS
jgi:Arc/MetJ family transcription regulator